MRDGGDGGCRAQSTCLEERQRRRVLSREGGPPEMCRHGRRRALEERSSKGNKDQGKSTVEESYGEDE